MVTIGTMVGEPSLQELWGSGQYLPQDVDLACKEGLDESSSSPTAELISLEEQWEEWLMRREEYRRRAYDPPRRQPHQFRFLHGQHGPLIQCHGRYGSDHHDRRRSSDDLPLEYQPAMRRDLRTAWWLDDEYTRADLAWFDDSLSPVPALCEAVPLSWEAARAYLEHVIYNLDRPGELGAPSYPWPILMSQDRVGIYDPTAGACMCEHTMSLVEAAQLGQVLQGMTDVTPSGTSYDPATGSASWGGITVVLGPETWARFSSPITTGSIARTTHPEEEFFGDSFDPSEN